MILLLRPRVSSRVSGFPVASPCLWGKLQSLSFSKVSKQVVMSFCLAGVALCDIPTCLITCRKCQTQRKSRTKCSFCCSHVSRLECLVFLVASPCLWGKRRTLHLHSTLPNLHFRLLTPLHTPHSTLYTPHFTLCTLHSSLDTLHSTLHTVLSTLCAPHSTLYTLHSSLHTLHSTLYTPHSTLHTLHILTLHFTL